MKRKEVERKIKHAKLVVKNCYREDGKIHPGLEVVVERKTRLIKRLEGEIK